MSLLDHPAVDQASANSDPLAIEAISQLVSRSGDPADTLANVVQLIQQQFQTDVCSIYLIKPDRANLVLAATVGLRPESVGRVSMKLNEGLTGLAAEQLRPIVVDDAPRHPRFKYFAEAGEEPYRSFVGVPLLDQGVIQGVLVVQTRETRTFSREETAMMVVAASQVAPIVSEARTLEQFIAPAYERIWSLARNLWWSWDPVAESLFRELDPVRWRELDHNPIALLSEISMDQLEERSRRHVLHSSLNYTYRRFQEYLKSDDTWGASHAGVLRARPVVYFSAEFGLHESVPIYSGGLGILAGDHFKSASDLGVPLVGMGLFYDQGYFRQHLTAEGWQSEDYLEVDVKKLPMELALGKDQRPITVALETRTGQLFARVWRMSVGRNSLYLLDSDVDGNAPEDRDLTSRLYGGDQRVRVRQELLLGVGGVRALEALGISPGVLHLNEGHSAFACLEMIRQRMQREGISFDESRRRVARQVVFTTHTPVPAGHDRFSESLVEEHLGPLRDGLGISSEELMAQGRVHIHNADEDFCMTVLALKNSRRANAVASLHGDVSRAMWQPLYPGRSEDEVPIDHITNGIHVPSWLAPQMRQLFDRHLGPDWIRSSSDPSLWDKIGTIDNGELWETHQVLKADLISFVRSRAVRQAEQRGEPREVLARLGRALSPDVLTIGFARRFATYKRANLLFQDLEQIAALINDPQLPVQVIFAGKAHPRDLPGKEVLQAIAQFTRDPQFIGKILFVEDYDINVGEHLVQGVDLWLNTPRRPLEASGTSGMKVVLNGGLNLSVLDGWWAEAYDGMNGFAVGAGGTHVLTDVHDRVDAESLYSVLEEQVIPLFYQRDQDGLPIAWISRMKNAIRTLGWRFNADRMVRDYVEKCYIPAAGGTSSNVRLS
ncbi:MAG TPA: alpha-glucan family phosphorylase [Pirellulales bacterium]|jgi:starch phosphorylase